MDLKKPDEKTAKKMEPELERILFLVKRDGVDSAIPSIKQILNTYRRAVLFSRKRGNKNPHFASLEKYRSKFIASYVAFKAFLTLHENYGQNANTSENKG